MKADSVERIAYSVSSAALLILSFPNFNLEFLAWFALIPWFFAIRNLKPRQAFLYSYLVGILFFLGTIWWLLYVSVTGLVLLTLYLALYFALFGLFFTQYTNRYALSAILFLPALWVFLEYIRSTLFGGFGWGLLGYSQYLNLPIIQIADITGAYGVSFLVVMVNVAIAEALGHRSWLIGYRRWAILIPIFLLFLSLGYGYYKLNLSPITNDLSPIRVSVVQGNIPQHQKWDEAFRNQILSTYENLTIDTAKERPDLIIWPETSLPGYLDEEIINRTVVSLAQRLKIPLLVGAPTFDGTNTLNSAVLFSQQGDMLAKYDKLHLVPFGEYIPFEKQMPFLRNIISQPVGDFVAGKEYTIFRLSTIDYRLSTNFGVLICFEDIFPGLVRQFVKEGAEFMVVITNDAWFGKTAAPNQHAQASVFRAVENRVPVVRSANTGLSCFIDKYGKIFDKVSYGKEGIFIKGHKTAIVALSGIASFYRGYGDIFAFLCIALSFLLTRPKI